LEPPTYGYATFMQRVKTAGRREWYELAAQIHEQAANDALNRGEMTKATLYAKRAARARRSAASAR